MLLFPAVAACADESAPDASGATTAAPVTAAPGSVERYSTPLAGVCPARIVVQTSWWPENDHAPFYQLVGEQGAIDANRYTYTGPLGSTGVDLEIRAGGPATGRQLVSSQLYADDAILLGLVTTDEQIANSSEQPTVSVMAWYQKTPLMFMWGNADWKFSSIGDIGASGVTVLAFSGATYIDVLIGKGLLKPEQIDESYRGDPARFVSENGNIAQQGFATSEPYKYENELDDWKRPVEFVLIADEYPVYPNSIVIREDKLEANRSCLEKLVPVLQQASVDYAEDPSVVNAAVTRFSAELESAGWSLSGPAAQDSYNKQIELAIVANGADGVFGSFDITRVSRLIGDLAPALEQRGKVPQPGLVASDIVTNEFLDLAIRM